jgi:CreA protein
MFSRTILAIVGLVASMAVAAPGSADSGDPDLIFRKSTTFKLLTPNDKLAVYGIDDPVIEGVACHYTASEKGGLAGALGLAEQTSDVSLACRQYGQIVRGCDPKRNILIYMVYTDKLVEGSPKNSTSSVPIQPWGGGGADVQKCADFLR